MRAVQTAGRFVGRSARVGACRSYSIQPERQPRSRGSGQCVYACGKGDDAQLGQGDREHSPMPLLVSELPSDAVFVDAAAGFSQSFVLTSKHELYSWGATGPSMLHPMRRDKNIYTPTLCEPAQSLRFTKIRIGRQHGMALNADGEVFVWGSAEFGQVGLGNNETQYLPVRIESLRDKGIVDIACGLDHSVAISKHGRVWTWGYNIDGQLGHNSTEDESKPKEISSLRGEKITRVVCGTDFTCLINSHGKLFTFGNGEAGQLGQGTRGLGLEPALVELENVKDVAAGGAHCLALTGDGQVWSWGWGEDGRLGHGDTEDHLTPAAITALGPSMGVVGLAAGGGHSLAITESGKAYGWGFNANGRLGLGKESASEKTPTLVEPLADKKVIRIVCGLDHTLFITQS